MPARPCKTEKRLIDSIALAPLVCRQQMANNAVRMEKREMLLPSLRMTVAGDFGLENAFACILPNNFYPQISSVVDHRISRQETATVLVLMQQTIVNRDSCGRFTFRLTTEVKRE